MRAFAVAVALVACGHTRGARSVDRTSESNLACTEDPSRSENPELPSRQHCLESPFTDANVEGLTHSACKERGHVFTHEGPRTPTPDEQVQFLEKHRKELHAFKGVTSSGYGACCEGGSKSGCVRVSIDLCTTPIAELARAFASWVESDAQMFLLIELSGATGPRCDGKKGPCGPTAYTSAPLAKAGYRCDGAREPIGAKGLAWGKCAHDGECNAAGCGNQCVPWTEANLIGTCEGYMNMEDAPAFCGCVDGSCAWFQQ